MVDEAFAKRWHDLRQQGHRRHRAHYRQSQEARLLLDDRPTLRGIRVMLDAGVSLVTIGHLAGEILPARKMSKTAAIQTLKTDRGAFHRLALTDVTQEQIFEGDDTNGLAVPAENLAVARRSSGARSNGASAVGRRRHQYTPAPTRPIPVAAVRPFTGYPGRTDARIAKQSSD